MLKLFKKVVKSEEGMSLVEVIIALGLLGLIATSFLMAIFIAAKSIGIADERSNAESLARAQMEYIKQQPYQDYDDGGFYLVLVPDDPTAYEIILDTPVEIEQGLQRITVTIGHPGVVEPILTLEGYRVDESVY